MAEALLPSDAGRPGARAATVKGAVGLGHVLEFVLRGGCAREEFCPKVAAWSIWIDVLSSIGEEERENDDWDHVVTNDHFCRLWCMMMMMKCL